MVISGFVTFVLAPLGLVVGLAAALLAGRRRAGAVTFDETHYPGLRALRRATVHSRLLGLGAGLVVALAALSVGRLAPLAFAAPLLAATAVVIAIMVGQRSAYSGARVAGSAAVERRQLGDYLPRSLARAVAGLLVLLIAVSLYTTLGASPDDMGRAGRAVSTWWVEGADPVSMGSTRTPFPGSFYSVWVVMGVVLLLVAAAIALIMTVRRPRNGADPELVRVDDALRRITAEGIVAAVGGGVGGAVLTVAMVAAMQLLQLGPVPVATAAGVLLAAAALLAFVGVLAAGVILLVPRDAGGR